MGESRGWAVFDQRGPIVATVSPTRRAAIINWLVTEWQCPITRGTVEQEINELWTGHSNHSGVRVGEVTIRERPRVVDAALSAREAREP